MPSSPEYVSIANRSEWIISVVNALRTNLDSCKRGGSEACSDDGLEYIFHDPDTAGGPIIRQVPPEAFYGDDVRELSTGVLIGRAIGLALLAGTLLYFYLTQ